MRVIAGTAKGTQLTAPKRGTRPTTDRVREAVFSVIADWAGRSGVAAEQQLVGLGFLDLYAGSSALAIEAASRGAAPVLAVDSDAVAVDVSQANVRRSRLPVKVVRAGVDGFLNRAMGGFDIIWLDPPYDLSGTDLDGVLGRLPGRALTSDGLVAVERSARSVRPDWPSQLSIRWDRHYGESVVYFAQADDRSISDDRS